MSTRHNRRARHRRHKRACAQRSYRRRLGLPERGDLTLLDQARADWSRVDSVRRRAPARCAVLSVFSMRNPWLDGVAFVPVMEARQ